MLDGSVSFSQTDGLLVRLIKSGVLGHVDQVDQTMGRCLFRQEDSVFFGIKTMYLMFRYT